MKAAFFKWQCFLKSLQPESVIRGSTGWAGKLPSHPQFANNKFSPTNVNTSCHKGFWHHPAQGGFGVHAHGFVSLFLPDGSCGVMRRDCSSTFTKGLLRRSS